MDPNTIYKVLFICTHNSTRSQMAEAILRKNYGNHYLSASAGTKPGEINPFTKQVLMEIDIDVSTLKTRNVNEFLGQEIDLVVTLCDEAKEECPFFPGAKQYEHISFEDPSKTIGDEIEIIKRFRKVRDDISNWIDSEFQ